MVLRCLVSCRGVVLVAEKPALIGKLRIIWYVSRSNATSGGFSEATEWSGVPA
ncbi:MAG: hypothetical protein ACK58L_07010 [Planctomycetota bacterium]